MEKREGRRRRCIAGRRERHAWRSEKEEATIRDEKLREKVEGGRR